MNTLFVIVAMYVLLTTVIIVWLCHYIYTIAKVLNVKTSQKTIFRIAIDTLEKVKLMKGIK